MLWNSITLFKTIHTKYYDLYTYEKKLFFLSSGQFLLSLLLLLFVYLPEIKREERPQISIATNKYDSLLLYSN